VRDAQSDDDRGNMASIVTRKDVSQRELKKITAQLDSGGEDFEKANLDKAAFGTKVGAGVGASTAHRAEEKPTNQEIYHGSREE
jgi:hypothetical protein